MALTTSKQNKSSAASMSADAYRKIMLGSTPIATKPKTQTPANQPPQVARTAAPVNQPPAAKPVAAPTPAPALAPAAKPAVLPGASPANQPPPQPSPTNIDNSKGGAGAGVLPGKPVVPPTDKGVPPNMGPGAMGGGTQGGIPAPITFTPPPPTPKKTVAPLAPTQAYPTAASFNPDQYKSTASAPAPAMSYRTPTPANGPGAFQYNPAQMKAGGAAYPTITPGQTSVPQRSTAVNQRAYPTGTELPSAPRAATLPPAMSYTPQRPANQPPVYGVGTGNRVPLAPTQSYGQITKPGQASGYLSQPGFMSYPGQQALPTPPPVRGYTPPSSPYDAGGRMAGPGGYNPGAGASMAATQGAGYAPSQSPYDASGRMGGGGPSYQEIMMRQQTNGFMPSSQALSPQQLMALQQGQGAGAGLTPQQIMALRQGGGY